MKLHFSYKNIIYLCWYLMLASIGFEYLSKPLFLLEAVTVTGLLSLFFGTKLRLFKKDLHYVMGMFFVLLGTFVSRLFYTTELAMFVNISFVIKTLLFFLFVYFFISRYGFPKRSLVLISFFSFPHFIGYVLGLDLYSGNQFGGFHGDPNYLGPDLLASFSASLVMINQRNLGRLKWIFVFTLLVSVFLILLSVSRTATMAALVIMLFYFFKLGISNKDYFWLRFLTFLATFFLCFVMFSPDLSDNVYIQRLNDRFFNSSKGGDLVENERYLVWEISYRLIQENAIFKGYGVQEFLKKQYHFLSHNAWLDIGIKMGSYSFWSHAIISGFGLIFWIVKYLKRMSKISTWGTNSYMLIFSISVSLMMFSISVSHMYYYWFILFIVYIVGWLPWRERKLALNQRKQLS